MYPLILKKKRDRANKKNGVRKKNCLGNLFCGMQIPQKQQNIINNARLICLNKVVRKWLYVVIYLPKTIYVNK